MIEERRQQRGGGGGRVLKGPRDCGAPSLQGSTHFSSDASAAATPV